MHEHEPGEGPRTTAPPRSIRTAAVHPLLALQAQAGNAAVSRLAKYKNTPYLALTQTAWDHVSKGEVKGSGDNRYVTGYHWTGKGGASLVERTGQITGPDGIGVYQSKVQSREAFAKQKGGGTFHAPKTDKSTFFPDAWNATRVKRAIRHARDLGSQKAVVELAGQPEHQMELFHNDVSVFPVYE